MCGCRVGESAALQVRMPGGWVQCVWVRVQGG